MAFSLLLSYLNSGMFIGYLKEVLQMLAIAEQQKLSDDDDDQLFYTKLYLDTDIRVRYSKILLELHFFFLISAI
jgi:hypothetical protein